MEQWRKEITHKYIVKVIIMHGERENAQRQESTQQRKHYACGETERENAQRQESHDLARTHSDTQITESDTHIHTRTNAQKHRVANIHTRKYTNACTHALKRLTIDSGDGGFACKHSTASNSLSSHVRSHRYTPIEKMDKRMGIYA